LINEGKPILLFDHPLNVRRIRHRVCKADWDANLGEQIDQMRMGRRMEFRITKDSDTRSYFVEVKLCLKRQWVIGSHAHDKLRMCDGDHVQSLAVDGARQYGAIERNRFKPLQN
jgi:hypothetical protein